MRTFNDEFLTWLLSDKLLSARYKGKQKDEVSTSISLPSLEAMRMNLANL